MEPPPISARKCRCCKGLFSPAPTNRGTQRFCSLAACRKASKARSNRQWRCKNPDYDRGPEQVERVRRWRAKNAGYGRARRRPKPAPALQDLVPRQAPDLQLLAEKVAAPPSDFAPGEPSCNGAILQEARALQDFVHTQDPLLVGLITTILGDAPQESFESFTRGLVEQGRRVLAAQRRDAPGRQAQRQTASST